MKEEKPLSDHDLAFIDQISDVISESGLPRSVGKVLGFLLVCEPDYQSSETIQEQLHLSSGSTSTATSLLRRIQLITTVTRPGDRKLYYRLDPDCWNRLLQLRIQQAERGHAVAQRGIALHPNNSRISGMAELYDKSLTLIKQLAADSPHQ